MSTFIALSDGRAWWAANWVYDSVLEAAVRVLEGESDGRPLGAWLRDQMCSVQGPGLGFVDMRELSEVSRSGLLRGLHRALSQARTQGAVGWVDPSAFSRWIEHFELLLRMQASLDRGEPPEALNPDSSGPMAPTGERKGPGW